MTNEQKPDSFLIWAILSTLFCCLPFGIVAIVYATKVDSAWYGGDHEVAIRNANKAKTWTMVAAGSGLLCIILYMIFVFGLALLG